MAVTGVMPLIGIALIYTDNDCFLMAIPELGIVTGATVYFGLQRSFWMRAWKWFGSVVRLAMLFSGELSECGRNESIRCR